MRVTTLSRSAKYKVQRGGRASRCMTQICFTIAALAVVLPGVKISMGKKNLPFCLFVYEP